MVAIADDGFCRRREPATRFPGLGERVEPAARRDGCPRPAAGCGVATMGNGQPVPATPQERPTLKQMPNPTAGYAEPAERPPLLHYLAFMGIFNSLVAAALVFAGRRGRELPDRVDAGDLALVGVASHKLSRLISKDKVTSPLRAPFTELEGPGGPAELEETPRGTGIRRTIGQLLVCPYCLGLWVVAAFSIGLLLAPRVTRFVASLFAALTISDFFQIAYKAAEEKGLG